MRNGGAAQKIRKRRRVLIALRAVVIPSVAEGSLWHYGQYHIGTDTETMPWCYVFLRSHIHRFPVCKKDFSLALEMTMRESMMSPSHQSLIPAFKLQGCGGGFAAI